MKFVERREFYMKNDYWKLKISTLDILKLDVYQPLLWKSKYPDLDKKAFTNY